MAGVRKALIVATDEYGDPKLTRLNAPAEDARALAEVLEDQAVGAFEVQTVLNQNCHDVEVAIATFFAAGARGDTLLVHFSCHGVKDISGELYFATRDTRLPLLKVTGVSSAMVKDAMESSRASLILCLVDCCYSGAFTKSTKAAATVDLTERLGGYGRAVITASTSLQLALDGEEEPSLFTHAVVEGLRSGDADRDLDGLVSLDEFYSYVHDRVTAQNPDQTPVKSFDVRGDVYVARRGGPITTPAPLPRELVETLATGEDWQRRGAVSKLADYASGDHPGRALAARLQLERVRDNDDSLKVRAAATSALEAAGETELMPEIPEYVDGGAEPPGDRSVEDDGDGDGDGGAGADRGGAGDGDEGAGADRGGAGTGDEGITEERAGDERAGDERASDERAGDERAGDERAGDERADDERAGDERADDERADDERAGDERAGDERAGDERAGDERADDEDDGGSTTGGSTGGGTGGGTGSGDSFLRRHRKRVLAGSAVAALGVVVVLGFALSRPDVDDGGGTDSNGSSVIAEPQPRLPDSELLVPVLADGERTLLAVDVESGDWTELLAGVDLPTLSHDRTMMSYIRVVDADGRRDRVAYTAQVDLRREAPVLAREARSSCPSSSRPAVSHDGGSLAFVCRDESGTSSGLWVLGAEDDDPTAWLEDSRVAEAPTWTGNGELVFVLGDNGPAGQSTLMGISSSGGQPEQLTEGTTGWDSHPDWSEAGVLFLRSPDDRKVGDVYVLEEGAVTRLTSRGDVESPTWSPDGTEIAYVAPGTSGGKSLWVQEADIDAEPIEIVLDGEPGAPAWGDR